MNEILVYNPGKGYDIIDLKTNGFDKLLQKDFKEFANWMSDNLQPIHIVLGDKIGQLWMNFKETENKIREEKMKIMRNKKTELLIKYDKYRKLISHYLQSLKQWKLNTIYEEHEKALSKYKKVRQEEIDTHKLMKVHWNKLKKQLIRERGIWGPLEPGKLSKYKLDTTEGPFRMRKRQKRNYEFYEDYPYIHGLPPNQNIVKIPTSFDCKSYYELYKNTNSILHHFYLIKYSEKPPKPTSKVNLSAPSTQDNLPTASPINVDNQYTAISPTSKRSDLLTSSAGIETHDAPPNHPDDTSDDRWKHLLLQDPLIQDVSSSSTDSIPSSVSSNSENRLNLSIQLPKRLSNTSNSLRPLRNIEISPVSPSNLLKQSKYKELQLKYELKLGNRLHNFAESMENDGESNSESEESSSRGSVQSNSSESENENDGTMEDDEGNEENNLILNDIEKLRLSTNKVQTNIEPKSIYSLSNNSIDKLIESTSQHSIKRISQSATHAGSDAHKQHNAAMGDEENQENKESQSGESPIIDFLEEEEFSDDEEKEKIQRMLENGDKIEAMYNCDRIDGMIKHKGIFVLSSKQSFYIIDGYEIEYEGNTEILQEIKINNQPSMWKVEDNEEDENNRNYQIVIEKTNEKHETNEETNKNPTVMKHTCKKWSYEDIKDIYKRRYLLRPVAIEIFMQDGKNHLISFDANKVGMIFNYLSNKIIKLANKVVINEYNDKLQSNNTHLLGITMAQQEEQQQQGNTNRFGLNLNVGALSRFLKKETITQKWVQGQISNFQYLMHLNIIGCRSYNDLTQYPVFPWILSDYDSEYLNLNDPKIYRDLSKPMGAIYDQRANEFQLRYENWEPDEQEGVPKWHYGSHYSSAGIVLYYLIRQESFTQQYIHHLQSGRFDVPDRLFHSIKETWLSAAGATMNLSDVKELIPEFFYSPEFLLNKNKFNFGTRQTKEVVDNVELPRWAKGSVFEFIRIHRLALESEYVSSHLHEWIDLIFGYKQQGKPAADALNVFYYLTYEGTIDIDKITDPIEKDR